MLSLDCVGSLRQLQAFHASRDKVSLHTAPSRGKTILDEDEDEDEVMGCAPFVRAETFPKACGALLPFLPTLSQTFLLMRCWILSSICFASHDGFFFFSSLSSSFSCSLDLSDDDRDGDGDDYEDESDAEKEASQRARAIAEEQVLPPLQ